MTPDVGLATPCGLYCGSCEYLHLQCKGCSNQNGKPFWTPLMKVKVCPLYDCCVNAKKLEHCGLCKELPCKTFTSFYDPSLSEQQAQQSVIDRQNELLRRKQIGTSAWLAEKSGIQDK